jgi:hypothetical protein
MKYFKNNIIKLHSYYKKQTSKSWETLTTLLIKKAYEVCSIYGTQI